jgi:hypothetical protein
MPVWRHPGPWLFALLLCLAGASWGQAPGELAVSGEGFAARTITAAELAALPRVTVQTKTSNGVVNYEGVALFELLKFAKAPLQGEIRGDKLRLIVVAKAADGYRVVFALAELDPSIAPGTVIVADRRDGQPLPAAEGPLRIVAPGDKRPARSARQVQSITLKRVE